MGVFPGASSFGQGPPFQEERKPPFGGNNFGQGQPGASNGPGSPRFDKNMDDLSDYMKARVKSVLDGRTTDSYMKERSHRKPGVQEKMTNKILRDAIFRKALV